jgi:DNA polymerase-3 subunit alpha
MLGIDRQESTESSREGEQMDSSSDWWHAHAHSHFSTLDGMPTVADMVQRADKQNQPALALTDHGNMSGAVQLYQECKKVGLAPFPGCEFYVVPDITDKNAQRYHVGILALDFKGYQGLAWLSSLSHRRDHFHRKPRFDFAELIQFGERFGTHVAVLSGCHFGVVIQTLIEHGSDAAGAILQSWCKVFPNLYVEIQHHDTKHDATWDDENVAHSLMVLARQFSLPVMVTNDAHYTHQRHKPVHEMMKRLGYHGDPNDYLFPGDSYHLASTKWVREHYTGMLEWVWDAAEEGAEDLLMKNKLRIPALDTYKFMVPEISSDPIKVLEAKVKMGMARRFFEMIDSYDHRMKYEMTTIRDMGMSNYFLLIADIVQWCRDNDIMVEARGSANGSLICYVTGITAVDPILWKLSFDRFLHPSRKKPPDIDLDIERDARPLVLEYASKLMRKHGGEVCAISTYGRLGADQEGRGSIAVKYLGWKRREIDDPAEFKRVYGNTFTLEQLEEINEPDVDILRELANLTVYSGVGTHAAGYIMTSPQRRLKQYLPTMLVASSDTTVTQMTMDDAESLGYMKGDFLGQSSLNVMKRCLELIGKVDVHATGDWYSWIPKNDKEACKLLRAGLTDTGIFQFEGYSTAKGGKQMKVKSEADAILCLALYRPAAMKSGHTEQYLERRADKSLIKYLHPIFEKTTKDTHGVFIFQDQVIETLRDLGMGYEDLNDMLKAVKASNDKVVGAEITFQRIRPLFLGLCHRAGMTPDVAKEAWRLILDFSDYGFNRSHATGYGLRAYRSAYLKAHYPLEYMCSILETWAGTPKERVYIREARRVGIKIKNPDLNVSGANWTIDPTKDGVLRKGLLSVPYVGQVTVNNLVTERDEGGPFKDMDDYCLRKMPGGKGYKEEGKLSPMLASLRDVGALESLGLPKPDMYE